MPDWKHADKLNIYVKRDDLIHPIVSGNKWRKLKYAITQLPQTTSRIVSFGGGFSNHLHALGYVCYKLSLPFTAIVRGDYSASITPMLADLVSWNTDIRYVSKQAYKQREDSVFLEQINVHHPNTVIIPEGGKQPSALKGVGEVIKELSFTPDYLMVPVGSGATLAGLIPKLDVEQKAIGIAVLKGEGYLEEEVKSLLSAPQDNWHIHHQFHHGGYAKHTEDLIRFCDRFNRTQTFSVEPVYSGKLFYAAKYLIENNHFREGSTLVLIHTGGMQGARKKP